MVRFVCCCANIRVHCERAGPWPPHMRVISEDPFLKNEPLAATLDIAGVTMEIPFLCLVRAVGDWHITHCANCGIDTHAVNKSSHLNSVLISKELEGDPAKQDILTHDPHYSQAFKILLNHNVTDDKLNGNHREPGSIVQRDNEQLVPIKEHIMKDKDYNHTLNRKSAELLKKERDLMMERIRVYNAQQHADYAKLQSIIHDEQQYILRRIGEVLNITSPRAEAEPANELMTNNYPANIADRSRKAFESDYAPAGDAKPDPRRDFPPKRSDKKKLMHAVTERKVPSVVHGLRLGGNAHNFSQSLDSNAIFPMDELENGSEDDLFADEESDGEVEELYQASSRSSAISHSLFATSLPVAMPGCRRTTHNHSPHANNFELESDSESDPFKATNPEEIAASIQALAQSVRVNDGTEMFGGLPRPRLNTLG